MIDGQEIVFDFSYWEYKWYLSVTCHRCGHLHSPYTYKYHPQDCIWQSYPSFQWGYTHTAYLTKGTWLKWHNINVSSLISALQCSFFFLNSLILQQDESYVTCWSKLPFVIFIIKRVSNSTILVHKLPASRLSKVKVVVFTPITFVPGNSRLTLTATTSITLKILRTYNSTTNYRYCIVCNHPCKTDFIKTLLSLIPLNDPKHRCLITLKNGTERKLNTKFKRNTERDLSISIVSYKQQIHRYR